MQSLQNVSVRFWSGKLLIWIKCQCQCQVWTPGNLIWQMCAEHGRWSTDALLKSILMKTCMEVLAYKEGVTAQQSNPDLEGKSWPVFTRPFFLFDPFAGAPLFLPFLTTFQPFSPPRKVLCSVEQRAQHKLGERQFQNGPLHKVREGNAFPKSAWKQVRERKNPFLKRPSTNEQFFGTFRNTGGEKGKRIVYQHDFPPTWLLLQCRKNRLHVVQSCWAKHKGQGSTRRWLYPDQDRYRIYLSGRGGSPMAIESPPRSLPNGSWAIMIGGVEASTRRPGRQWIIERSPWKGKVNRQQDLSQALKGSRGPSNSNKFLWIAACSPLRFAQMSKLQLCAWQFEFWELWLTTSHTHTKLFL